MTGKEAVGHLKTAITAGLLGGITLASLMGARAGLAISQGIAARRQRKLHEKLINKIIDKISSDKHEESVEHARHQLHRLVRPMGKVYKTRGAAGWDVMSDAMLSSDQGTGAGK